MRYRILLMLWVISDLLLFVGSYVLAYFLRVGWILSSDFPFDQFMVIVALVSPVWLLFMTVTRTFGLSRKQHHIRNGIFISSSAIVTVALFTLSYYFTYADFFSRLLLIYAFVIQTSAVWIWHIFFDEIKRTLLRRAPPTFPTLVIGVTRESKALVERLNRNKNPLTPVAILDATGSKETSIDSVPILGKLNKLEETIQKFGITHLIQCSDLEQSLNLLSACRNRGITYVLLPSVLGIVEGDERVESIEEWPVTMVAPGGSAWQWFFR